METISRQVTELDSNVRVALEQMIGHTLSESQEVTIQVSEPVRESNGKVSNGKLPDWCNVYEGLSNEEIEDLSRSIVRQANRRDF
jgi:hypothetical protein